MSPEALDDDWRLPPARNAGELVFEQLRHRIVEGELAHGTKLSEAQIVARMGVSRTPVREALTRLAAGGLLRPAEGNGYLVVDPLADLEELVLTREALEGAAARLAAGRATEAQRARICALAEESNRRDRGEYEVRSELNAAFHDAVLTAAHSPRLTALAESYRMFFASPRLMRMMTAEETEAALADHTHIAAAISRGDGQQAEEVARRHLRQAYANTLATARATTRR
ncbi:GntR family transcriptional regulator [Rhodovarius crocodyli]|uniref:GntR family transcriptional regulator n=1 Tax=Rhodovarius crocodyli TaxID=1979269 RepID=A0A437M2H4_9PROT|nr:GntR family transcriptional regulator [Rhodovarius crocodyli]RVT91704.1 GntR family transcriptional regulator [Rhodovarius crocodyli]